MEFLDPEEKKSKFQRLMLGYAVSVVAIISATIVLAFVSQGADLFSRNIDVRNGLLFMDSKPVSVAVVINDNEDGRTDARYVLPEGEYDVKLYQQGYRDWSKTLEVVGGSVVSHTYPKLFPTDIKQANVESYSELPFLDTASLDRQWLVVGVSKTSNLLKKYKAKDVETPAIDVVIPKTVVDFATISTFEEIEWSTDDKNVVYKLTTAEGEGQYYLINIDKPAESVNLTAKLKLPPTATLTLRDKKADKYYVLDSTSQILKSATLKGGLSASPVATGVKQYEYHGADVIIYTTEVGAEKGYLSVNVYDGHKTTPLKPILKGGVSLLNVATYENDWLYLTGSSVQDFAQVYINPLDRSHETDVDGQVRADFRLGNQGAIYSGFSNNARFLAVQSASEFTVFDAEYSKIYRYDSKVALPPEGATWMDGYRFQVVSNNRQYVFEFDGENLEDLAPALNGTNIYYDKDYINMYTFITNPTTSERQLQVSSLVYGE